MDIGIFGVGSFGEKHINVLKNIKSFNIIGFYDPNQKRSKEIEKKFQIKCYKNPNHLIKKCHAIDIVSETSTHYNLIEKGVNHNKHIFIEKPICSNISELKNILKKTEKYESVIQVGHIERYNPAISQGFSHLRNIKSIISKRTGSLNDRNKNTSIILDLMIHDIDLIMNNTNSKIKKINAVGKKKLNGLYNDVRCEIIFKNGTIANLISIRKKNMISERKITINCTNKIVEIDLLNRMRKNVIKKEIEIFNYKKNINLLEKEFLEFYECVKKKRRPLVGVKEACAAVNIALKIGKLINQK